MSETAGVTVPPPNGWWLDSRRVKATVGQLTRPRFSSSIRSIAGTAVTGDGPERQALGYALADGRGGDVRVRHRQPVRRPHGGRRDPANDRHRRVEDLRSAALGGTRNPNLLNSQELCELAEEAATRLRRAIGTLGAGTKS